MHRAVSFVLLGLGAIAIVACAGPDEAALDEVTYRDKVHGAWVTTMVANHSGLPIEGQWLSEPGQGEAIELVLLDEWSTDDDTHVEWLYLHILEEHGRSMDYDPVIDEWIEHLNNDIWVATRAARDLMDSGLRPPQTGQGPDNPLGEWSIGAQLQTELFGLLNPGDPDRARIEARFYAQVTNNGPAVDASAFYAHLYAMAFVRDDITGLLRHARDAEAADSLVATIVDDVLAWHEQHPDDWRATRELIRQTYDTDPDFYASRVNFAATIMALRYGDGDLRRTIDIAGLAGWDADNNMTTAAGLLGIISGFADLPEPFASATDVYFNQDLTGELPRYDSVANIARRTADLGWHESPDPS